MKQYNSDLIILVADKDAEFTLKGLLPRNQAFGIRQITYDIYVHPEHDPGCLLRCQDFLRPFIHRYAYVLVMLDREGCGREAQSCEVLEQDIEDRLSRSGWQERAAAIVLHPELEIWVWNDSPHVDEILGWTGRNPPLKTWLDSEGFIAPGQLKPDQPKPALEKALRLVRKPRSSALYAELAQHVSFRRCVDPAFLKFRQILQRWFLEAHP